MRFRRSRQEIWDITLYVCLVSFVHIEVAGNVDVTTLTDREKQYIISKDVFICGPECFCSFSPLQSAKECDCGCNKKCYCDDLCHEYGDCCTDRVLEDLNSLKLDQSRYKCNRNTIKPSPFAPFEGFFFQSIQKCSLRHDDSLVQLCEHPDPQNLTLRVPARARDHLYRNQFCAVCNGETNYTLWKIKVGCSETVVMNLIGKLFLQLTELFVNNPECNVGVFPADGSDYRECFPPEARVISSCSWQSWHDGYDFEKLCHSHYVPVWIQGNIYGNIFCYMCNEGYMYSSIHCEGITVPVETFPLTMMFDVNAFEILNNNASTSSECALNYTFDSYKKECRLVECGAFHTLQGEMCFPYISSVEGYKLRYHLEVLLKSDTSLKMYSKTDVWIHWIGYKFMWEYLGGHSIDMGLLRIGVSVKRSPIDYTNEVRSISVSAITVLKWGKNMTEMESALLKLRHSNWTTQIDNMTVIFKGEPFWTDPDDDLTVYPSLTEVVIDTLHNIVKKDFYIFGSKESTQEHAYIDRYVSETLTCPRVKVFQDIDYKYNRTANIMTFTGSNTILDIGQFEPLPNNSGFVCVSAFKENVNQSVSPVLLFPNHLVYVSLICQVLSLICLLLTFLVFCTFKSLRTLPGKNTMSLVFTLFVTMLLFTVGSTRVEYPTICKVIGITIHFFLLSSFTWMAVCTVHMFTVFQNILKSGQTDFSNRKKYILYLVISIVIPGVTVGSAVASNLYLSDGMGYGSNICYVSNLYTIVLAVATPVAIVIILNGCLYVATVMALRRNANATSELKVNRNYISTYVKMSTVTGINWSLSLVFVLVDSVVIKYVFLIVCGLHGVYIFVSVVSNRNVLRLFRNRFRNK